MANFSIPYETARTFAQERDSVATSAVETKIIKGDSTAHSTLNAPIP